MRANKLPVPTEAQEQMTLSCAERASSHSD